MTDPLAVAAASFPVLAAWGFARASGRWPSRPLAAVAGMTVTALLWVVPVDAAEGLRRLGVVRRVLPATVLAIEVALVIASAFVWPILRRRGSAGVDPGEGRRSRFPWPIVAVQGLALGGLLAAAVAGHPGGAELLDRRLPTAVRWLQRGALTRPEPGEGPAGNVEVGLWLVLSTGRQRMAAAAALPALIAASLATAAIARRIRQGNVAVLAGLIVSTVPVVALPAYAGSADLAAGSAFLVAVALVLGRREPPAGLRPGAWRLAAVGLAGGAAGIGAGVGPAWVPAAAGLVAVFAVVDHADRRGRPFAALGGTGALFAGAMLGGAVGWLQGWGRAELTASWHRPGLGWSGLGTFRQRPSEWVLAWWTGPDVGPAWVTLVPAAAAYGLVLVLGWRRTGSGADVGVLRGVALGLVGVSAGWALGILPAATAVVVAAGLSCALASPGIARAEAARPRLYRLLVFGAVAVGAVFLGFGPVRDLRTRWRAERWDRTVDYGYPQVLDDLPPGTTVLDVNDRPPGVFALSGRALTNRVLRANAFARPFTRDALAAAGVDYVYDTPPFAADELAAAGAWPIFAGIDESPNAWGPCLIWKTDRRD